jgi:hypothetical protein
MKRRCRAFCSVRTLSSEQRRLSAHVFGAGTTNCFRPQTYGQLIHEVGPVDLSAITRAVEIYEPNDNYTRSCHWMLWSSISQQALLVSPEEADALIPIMRKERSVEADGDVHLLAYAAPVTRRMLHFNQLDYHATPPLPTTFEAPAWLRVELGIVSGRLYVEWDEYYTLLEYLGLDKDLSQHPEKQGFAKKPLTFRKYMLKV